MTEIYVAKNSGVLRAPSGEQHRLVAGQTLADGRHEAVTGSPDSWVPMVVELSVDGGQGPQDTEADPALFFERMTVAEAERDELLNVLNGIATILDERGLLEGVDREMPGWLPQAVKRIANTLAEPLTDEPEQVVVAGPADPETPEGRATIREWAWAQGLEVSERGQLPKAVVEAYRRNHA